MSVAANSLRLDRRSSMAAAGLPLLGALAVGWIAVGASLTIWSDGRLGLPLVPYAQAERLTADVSRRLADDPQSVAERHRILDDARAAFRLEPASVAAARNLGLLEASSNARISAEMMRYAQTLSRRDVATQLWLIEDKVSRGDVIGALHHYDVALRTSRTIRGVLFPVLFQAVDDPAVTAPFSRILARRPLWWADFLQNYAARNQSSSALASVTAELNLNPDIVGERQLLAYVLDRLVRQGDYRSAGRLYARASGGRRSMINDGGFETEPRLPPFDWTFIADDDVQVERRAFGRGNAAYITVATGSGGVALRQLLLLQPGQYILSYRTGAEEGRPVADVKTQITCMPTSPAAIAASILSAPSPAAGTVTVSFDVPAGCNAQSLTFSAGSPGATEEPVVRVDDVTIRRAQ